MSVFGDFLVCIFPYSDGIRRFALHLCKSPYSVQLREKKDQKRSEYEYFLPSAQLVKSYVRKVFNKHLAQCQIICSCKALGEILIRLALHLGSKCCWFRPYWTLSLASEASRTWGSLWPSKNDKKGSGRHRVIFVRGKKLSGDIEIPVEKIKSFYSSSQMGPAARQHP